MSVFEQAPASAAGKPSLVSDFRRWTRNIVVQTAKAFRSRRQVLAIRDLDDAQLADIGLCRTDVESVLQLPLSTDLTHHLIRARSNPLADARRR